MSVGGSRCAGCSGFDCVQHGGVVANRPVFDDQAVREPEDVNLRPGDEVAIDRQAFESREAVADVSAVGCEPDDYDVI
jgi:hypothetical protein